MFKKKEKLDELVGIGTLRYEVDDIKERLVVLERDRKQRDCGHQNIEFKVPYYSYYEKVCADCEKILETFSDEESFQKAKVKHLRKQVKEIEDDLKVKK